MRINKKWGIILQVALISFSLSCMVIIATTPLHEAVHWVMSEIDPYIEPVEMRLFDDISLQDGQNVLFSALGCVVIRERYPGAFKDRPVWADAFQEIVCISLQMLIAWIVVSRALIF